MAATDTPVTRYPAPNASVHTPPALHPTGASLAPLCALALALWGPAALAGDAPESRVAWEEPVEVARGEAFRGPWRMNASDFRYVDDASVAINDHGDALVVWADQAQQALFLQRYDRDGRAVFERPTRIGGVPGTFSWLPRVAVEPAPDDADAFDVHLLWQEILFTGGDHGGEILYARSRDGGRSFEGHQNLSRSRDGAGKGRITAQRWDNGSLDLLLTTTGEVVAAWTEYQGPLRVTYSADRGASFAEPVTVNPDNSVPARAPALAQTPSGRVLLAWSEGDSPYADIRIARSDNLDAGFSEPATALEHSGHADAPVLVVDAEGVVHLAFGAIPANDLEDYRQPHFRRLHVSRADADTLDFAPPTRIDADQWPGGFPTLARDDRCLYLVWQRYPHPTDRPWGLAFTHAPLKSARFGPVEAVPGTLDTPYSGGLQGQLKRRMAVNRHGAIAIAQSRFIPGSHSDILLIRGQIEEDGCHPNPSR
ncbi:sialidase family protein [Thioalkalivibrio sp. ALE9]|uniref:sialidase family protein n=1 Tax=Thioalkalivibrio sp. ALE9 TaxID=1158169 RepID=UPI0003792B4D|nr:sialidase family protein [Thioalkalivibrio sp. ALE9]